jgi:hypothetical protein
MLCTLQQLAVRATKLLEARAYVHQYQSFGVEVDDIHSSILNVEQLCVSYSQL